MKKLLFILLLCVVGKLNAQVTLNFGKFDHVEIGGASVTGVTSDVRDTASIGSTTMIPTLKLLSDMIKANSTTIYKGAGIIGSGSNSDKLRLDMDNLFYRSTTKDIKTWRHVQGMLFWSNTDGWCFYQGDQLMKVYATPIR